MRPRCLNCSCFDPHHYGWCDWKPIPDPRPTDHGDYIPDTQPNQEES